MTPHDEELLSRYLDGELEPGMRVDVEKRLAEDSDLAEAYRSLRELDAVAREVYPVQTFAGTVPPAGAKAASRNVWLAVLLTVLVMLSMGVYTVASRISERMGEEESSGANLSGDISTTAALEANTESEKPFTEPDTQDAPTDEAVASDGGARTVELTGIVRDPDGNPVAGARLEGWDFTGEEPEPTKAQALTTRDGTFEFFAGAVPNDISISAKGFVPQLVRYHTRIRDVVPRLEVTLFWGDSATGRVVDREGKPIPSVRVRSSERRYSDDSDSFTDADGRFRLARSLWPEGEYLEFSHESYAPVQVEGSGGEDVGTVVMTSAGTLEFHVVSGGTPVEGAEVHVADAEPLFTDVKGIATFRNLEPGKLYNPLVRLRNEYFRVYNGRPQVGLEGTTEIVLAVPSEAPRTYEGVVYGEDEDGQKELLSGATVRLSMGDFAASWTRTDEEGRFALEVTPRPELMAATLYVTHSTRPPYFAPFKPDETSMGTIELGPSQAAAEFKIAMPGGTPSALLVHMDQMGASALPSVFVITDPPKTLRIDGSIGRLQVAALNAKRANSDTQPYETYDLSGIAVDPDAAARKPLDELLLDASTGKLRGVVESDKGEPLKGAIVRAHCRSDLGERRPAFSYRMAQTNSDGVFEITPLLTELPYTLSVARRGYILDDAVKDSLEFYPRENPSIVRIVLRRFDQVLEGRVVDADGGGAAGAIVNVESVEPRRSVVSSRTDETGRFFVHLAPGTFAVSAYDEILGSAEEVVVSIPSSPIELRLRWSQAQLDETERLQSAPEMQAAANRLKQMGLVFKMFANEAKGQLFPEISSEFGAFTPNLHQIYPEYLTDSAILGDIQGKFGVDFFYSGYALNDQSIALSFLDAYEELGPEGFEGRDVRTEIETESGEVENRNVFRLREGIERFFITDINDPAGSALAQSSIPLMWEMPGAHDVPGGWVLYMDGHAEFRTYPGEFPMTEEVIERIREIQAASKEP